MQSHVWIKTRNHDVSDQVIQQVKYVLCHYTSSKHSCNEYRYTVPVTTMLINKNQLGDKKTILRIPREKKHVLCFYMLILVYLNVLNVLYLISFFYSANIY